MRPDVSVLFEGQTISPSRLDHVRRAVLEGISVSHSRRSPQRASFIVAIGLLAAILVVGGTALAVRTDFLSQQEEIDKAPWTPPEMRAAGPRTVLARGPDWAFMAWRAGAGGGVCVAYAAGTADGWARSCGRLPAAAGTEAETSRHLVTLLAKGGAASDAAEGKTAIVGAVVPSVVTVDLELADGRVVEASTASAPEAVGAGARFFIVRVQARADRPGALVRAVVMYAQGRRLVERFVAG